VDVSDGVTVYQQANPFLLQLLVIYSRRYIFSLRGKPTVKYFCLALLYGLNSFDIQLEV